jgi:hypothetical protein
MRAARIGCAAIPCCLAVVFVFFSALAFAQTDSGTVSGRVLDPAGRSVPGAKVRLIDIDRGTAEGSATNNAGLYTFRAVHPGRYRMEVEAEGFKLVNITGLTVNTQANLEQNFALSVGSVSESITVEAKASDVSTSVSTVVDRKFVENIPLNGRSFQTLMQLTPGVVVTRTSDTDSGQFSVNGQRASSNYFMVDGVSANIGSSVNPIATQNAAGSMPGLSVLGGTNNLVSVDALQEFRIQTSTYAPEFGRTPGAQISLETRSGTNQFHGTIFEYLRNDFLDASNWFNGVTNPPLHKSQERQNDFGGVFGGPLFKDKTFFFFSYEQQILRLPRTALSEVPSLAVRQDPSTPAAILPLLNAYPVPNGSPSAAEVAEQIAPFSASFSDPSTLKAASLRVDHSINDRLAVFGRYNYSPSALETRGGATLPVLSEMNHFVVKTETLTLGATWTPLESLTNDLRFNYSRNRSSGETSVDSFGGAIAPAASFFLPQTFGSRTPAGVLSVLSTGGLRVGPLANQLQRQMNLVESLSIQKGQHAIKLGVDYRRLSPLLSQNDYFLGTTFLSVASAASLTPLLTQVNVNEPVTILFHNLGAYVQDTWRPLQRLSLNYGLRWDVDFAPSTAHGPDFPALVNVGDPNTLGLASVGAPVFQTSYRNFAPRIGASYVVLSKPKYHTILKGGFGVFYDLATTQAGDLLSRAPVFPFGSSKLCVRSSCGASLTFPLPSALLQPAPIVLSPTQDLLGFDPNIHLPYTLQWNIALEQSLGENEVVSASYVGAVGRRLITEIDELAPPNSSRAALIIGNHATSDYHALQLQFRRGLSHNLQALASYSWSHSIDTASASTENLQNFFVAGLNPAFARGSSDFDVRHTFSAGLTYQVPSRVSNPTLKAIAEGWSFDSMIQGRSATPVDVTDSNLSVLLGSTLSAAALRPDLVTGQPLYLTGAACALPCPGGKALNPAAFVDPPTDPITGLPLREGDLARNALRGFGAFQWDSALTRTFALREKLHLLFRAEFFNVLNRPNFANPISDLASPFFGHSIQTLNQGLSGATSSTGGFSPLYQIGGPRSGQLAVKLLF